MVTTLAGFVAKTHIAYFSMEIALRNEMHSYSGGLGVLAGDTARSCADLDLPVVFVSLVSRKGYLRQEIDREGVQIELPDEWDPGDFAVSLNAKIALTIEGRPVWIRPWLYVLTCPLGHQVPVILLDTDLPENDAGDRSITDKLYGGDDAYRLRQEAVLGIGGLRMLEALGFEILKYHMNEGHAALLTLELLRRHRHPPERLSGDAPLYDEAPVIDRCIFTTHTPVESGHDQFRYPLVERVLGDFIALEELRRYAGTERCNMTRLALNLSGYVNGVAPRHAETTRRMFPGYHVSAIANGVHPASWAHSAFAKLYDFHFPPWAHEPEVLIHADQLSDDEIRIAHAEAKSDLLALVKQRCGIALDPNLPVLGFARRMTGYKRPALIFSDLQRLKAIHRRQPFQIVWAGKAHPRDEEGRRLIQTIYRHSRTLELEIPVVFLPNYDLDMAAKMVAGSDVWLNTPLPPLEASGTSGMKAAVNGVLNASVLDGWWVDAWIEGVTGWAIGDGAPETEHATALYAVLEEKILPLYADQARWIWMMKQSISKIVPYFNSQRMMRRYAAEAYLR